MICEPTYSLTPSLLLPPSLIRSRHMWHTPTCSFVDFCVLFSGIRRCKTNQRENFHRDINLTAHSVLSAPLHCTMYRWHKCHRPYSKRFNIRNWCWYKLYRRAAGQSRYFFFLIKKNTRKISHFEHHRLFWLKDRCVEPKLARGGIIIWACARDARAEIFPTLARFLPPSVHTISIFLFISSGGSFPPKKLSQGNSPQVLRLCSWTLDILIL